MKIFLFYSLINQLPFNVSKYPLFAYIKLFNIFMERIVNDVNQKLLFLDVTMLVKNKSK